MFAGLNNHVNNSHLNLSQSNTQISRFNKSTRKIKSLSSPKCNKFILYTRSVHYSKRPSANQESATTGSLYHRNLITVSKLLKGQRSYNKKYLCSLWYSDYTNTHTLRSIELHNTYIQKPCALNFESWAELEKCRPCNFRAMFNNWGVTFEFYHYLFLSLKNIFFYKKRQDLNSFIILLG